VESVTADPKKKNPQKLETATGDGQIFAMWVRRTKRATFPGRKNLLIVTERVSEISRNCQLLACFSYQLLSWSASR